MLEDFIEQRAGGVHLGLELDGKRFYRTPNIFGRKFPFSIDQPRDTLRFGLKIPIRQKGRLFFLIHGRYSMDYMLFFAVWIFGGLACFALNRVQPGASAAAPVEEPEEESAAEEEEEEEEEEE